MPLYRAHSVGSFPIDNSTWDPDAWKPRYSNTAFRYARPDDKFWTARRLQGFTNDMLNALPRVGKFDDPQPEAMLSKFLIDRRDAIVRRYLPAVNPIVDVRLTASGLTFRNAAVDADVAKTPREYVVRWSLFDNVTGATNPIGDTRGPGTSTSVAPPADLPSTAATYIRAEIAATGGPESWGVPVHAYFVRVADGWKLVGFERLPDRIP